LKLWGEIFDNTPMAVALETFATRIEQMEREECAKLIDKIGYSHTAGLSQFVANEFAKAANQIRTRYND